MRSPLRSLDAIFPGAILAAGLSLWGGERPAGAQIAPPASPNPTTSPGLPGSARSGIPGADENNNPMMRQLSEQQANRRNDMRQKLIVDDTARLLTLAQQLKEEADNGRINKSSVAITRKVEEIEKLAKTVKDKMREGQ